MFNLFQIENILYRNVILLIDRCIVFSRSSFTGFYLNYFTHFCVIWLIASDELVVYYYSCLYNYSYSAFILYKKRLWTNLRKHCCTLFSYFYPSHLLNHVTKIFQYMKKFITLKMSNYIRLIFYDLINLYWIVHT